MKYSAAAAGMLALACLLGGPSLASDVSSPNWSETAPGNSAGTPNGFPEGMAPSTLNDSAREMMAALRRWYDRANATRTSAGSANSQTLTYTVAPEAYRTGDSYAFIAGNTNTGAATLNVNGLGAKSIKSGPSTLSGGEIAAGRVVMVFYDGTSFQLLSGGSVASVLRLALHSGGCLALHSGGCLALHGP